MSRFGGYHLIAYIVYSAVHSVGNYTQLLFAGLYFSGVDNLVLRLQQGSQLFRVDTHTYQFVYGNKDIDYFCLYTEEGHLHDTVGSDHLCFNAFCPVAHLFIGESVVGSQSIVDTEYVTEVIGYRRNGCAIGKLGLYVEYFSS